MILKYERDKKAIENNLIKVSEKQNVNKISAWISNKTIFNCDFITYFYKKNEIWFEKITIAGFLGLYNNYILSVNYKIADEDELLKILNNTFYIDNEIVYNYNFLKDKKPISGFNVEFDIKEFAKLFVIKDKIKDF